jgi:HAD superfamily hydrolase (TIGR01458 family)
MAIRGVLIDLSGVVYVGDRLLPGAMEAIEGFRAAGLGLRFVTNTSRRCRARILGDLAGLGLDMDPDELLTAPLAGRRWLERHDRRPHLLIHPGLAPDFEGMETDDPDAVFLGDAAEYFDYARLNAAFRVLQDGAPLVAVARNRYFREADGLSLDMGAFVAALEYAAGTEAIIVGKPSAAFFREATIDLGLAPGEVVMVGDDVEADVLGALAAGLDAALVQTGKYRAGDEDALAQGGGSLFPDLFSFAKMIL